jgi:predicted nuclease with TOPRIM domain
MNEKLNEIMANHQSVMSEKDRQIIEYQKQIEKLQKIESDLSVQIEEQKVKNNVSVKPLNSQFNNDFRFNNFETKKKQPSIELFELI